MDIYLQSVTAAQKDTLYRLLQYSLFEESAADGNRIGADGLFDYPWFDAYFSEKDREAYLIREKGFTIENLDVTLIAQRPKVAPYIPLMKENLMRVLEVEEGQLNLKATTEEGLGFTGREEGISAHAVTLLV